MESYIEDKKILYGSIHEFLDEYDGEEFRKESLEKIINFLRSHPIEGDSDEMRQFLEIIKSIGEHHHRDQHFNERIYQLILHYKDQIKRTLSNSQIFHIFENNKKIVLFLLQKDIITISDAIYKEMIYKIENNGNRYCHFFLPELEQFAGEEKMKFVKNELLNKDPSIFTNYDEKRKEGENDSQICFLIRQDSVEEFIEYMNRQNISPSDQILPSIFETNPFLIDNKNTTLIEYSAFFGSIQIFQYLLMSKAELTPSLWLYGIHSKNAELIDLLESNKVLPPPPKFNIKGKESIGNYVQCLAESIKCHHNDIADYIDNKYINQEEKDLQQKEEIISNCIKYHNYKYFQNEIIIDHGFFYLSHYQYDKLFELLLKKKEESIENKMIQYRDIRSASENNEIEVVYHYLLKMKEISEKLFKGTKIKQITIPSSVTSIGGSAFSGCSSLTQITIPSSVTSIGSYAFYECSSLTQITIPSFVTSIGNSAFEGCSSLAQITFEIPSSVNSIGKYAFERCSSLTQIAIPSSVTSIGHHAFSKCSSLTQITIPSSVTLIGKYAFYECSSLIQITIPSSVTSIGNCAFYECSSLTQITFEIPTSVTSIGNCAFYECSSLTQITIPSSITSIGNFAFSGCSSLTQITIPSSVTSIRCYAFFGCSSLTKITIPSSVTSIGYGAFANCPKMNKFEIFSCGEKRIEYFEDKFLHFKTNYGSKIYNTIIWVKPTINEIIIPAFVNIIGNHAFYRCSSLTQITIPSSVTLIGDYAFSRCSSLTQITIPSSVHSIGNYAFGKCSSLTQITFEIPSSVASIRDSTFFGCSSLPQITIPSSVTSINDYAFFGCSSLTQITFEIPSSVNSIGSCAFSGCSSLAQITIPSSVNSIGYSAFKECSSLTQITIPSSVTSIGDFAFSRCPNLQVTRV